jgi:hypothetical protein
MAKAIYIGVSSKARKVSNAYIGVSGTARKIKNAYIGVNGTARLFYSKENPYKNIAVGDTFTFNNSTFLAVHKDTDNNILYACLQKIYSTMVGSSYNSGYGLSNMYKACKSYASSMNATDLAYCKEITCNDGSNSYYSSTTCKVWLPDNSTARSISCLSYFKTVSNRIAYYGSYTYGWWLGTVEVYTDDDDDDDYYASIVTLNGYYSSCHISDTNYSFGFRPFVAIDLSLEL